MTTEPKIVVLRAKPKQVLAIARLFFVTKPTNFVRETEVGKLF